MEENIRRYKIREQKEVEFKEKCIVAKLAGNTTESYAYVLRMDEDEIPCKIMNVKRKLRSSRDQNGNKLGKMSHRRKLERKGKLRRMRYGMTEAVAEDWSLNNPQEAERSKHREE